MGADGNPPKRGFASMNEERRREIASKGGKSVPAEKRHSPRTLHLPPNLAAREARTPRAAGRIVRDRVTGQATGRSADWQFW
jgi:Stress-induced bacterial acidophilic repeat motif